MAGGRVLFFSAPCGFSKTALDEALPEPPPPPENKHEQKLCVIKRSEKSCAVR